MGWCFAVPMQNLPVFQRSFGRYPRRYLPLSVWTGCFGPESRCFIRPVAVLAISCICKLKDFQRFLLISIETLFQFSSLHPWQHARAEAKFCPDFPISNLEVRGKELMRICSSGPKLLFHLCIGSSSIVGPGICHRCHRRLQRRYAWSLHNHWRGSGVPACRRTEFHRGLRYLYMRTL